MLGRMQPPQLRQMRYVVEVAKLRSFTRAAERLHVAQQALSQQVKVVEHLLGVRLFVRTSHGVELTPAGVVFAQEARRVLNAADRVVARTQAAERGEHGVVRVAYTLATVYGTLPAIIDGLAERHPSLKVELREVFGGDVEGLLLEGRYDVAACPRTAMRADIKRVQLRREPFIVALSQQHRLAGRDCLTVAELAEERFEVWPRDMAPGFYDAGRRLPRRRFRADRRRARQRLHRVAQHRGRPRCWARRALGDRPACPRHQARPPGRAGPRACDRPGLACRAGGARPPAGHRCRRRRRRRARLGLRAVRSRSSPPSPRVRRVFQWLYTKPSELPLSSSDFRLLKSSGQARRQSRKNASSESNR